MAIERQPGRKCPDNGFDFPAGCSAGEADCVSPCGAQLAGKRCLLCTRSGELPVPPEWPWASINIVGSRSIQLIRFRRGIWLVVVFISGCRVDPRMPPIAYKSREGAEHLALARARQIEPTAPIERRGEGDWRVGGLVVWTIGDD